jgi:hypothetical protein
MNSADVLYIDGFTVTYDMILQKYEEIERNNYHLFRRLGNPEYDVNTRNYLAIEIVNNIRVKMGLNRVDENAIENKEEFSKRNNQLSEVVDNTKFWGGINWLDQDHVFKKALEDLENKIKEQEKIRLQSLNEKKSYNYEPPKPKEEIKDETFQEILQIDTLVNLTEEKIKKCYYKLAKIYHPDLNGGSEEKMKKIIEAKDKALMFIGVKT